MLGLFGLRWIPGVQSPHRPSLGRSGSPGGSHEPVVSQVLTRAPSLLGPQSQWLGTLPRPQSLMHSVDADRLVAFDATSLHFGGLPGCPQHAEQPGRGKRQSLQGEQGIEHHQPCLTTSRDGG